MIGQIGRKVLLQVSHAQARIEDSRHFSPDVKKSSSNILASLVAVILRARKATCIGRLGLTSKTALNDIHREMGGKMVDFGGWDMPLHYGSQLKEHLQVRGQSGMFDVSHMTVVDIQGPDAAALLRVLLANDIAKLTAAGQALYSVMLNTDGGVIDDLIAYFRAPDSYRLVVNCATRAKDLAWIIEQSSGLDLHVQERPDLGIIAVQGPRAQSIFRDIHTDKLAGAIPNFGFVECDEWMIAATGYTGELGFEVILPNSDILQLWQKLHEAGIEAVGLGARDTLRLEAGYCLYGHEMDEQTSPLAANLGWTLDLSDSSRKFVGRPAIEEQKASGAESKLVGLVLEDRGVLRTGQQIFSEDGLEGLITSGSYSPSLEKSIALARVPMSVSDYCDVLVRNKKLRARIVKPAFVRQGKVLV